MSQLNTTLTTNCVTCMQNVCYSGSLWGHEACMITILRLSRFSCHWFGIHGLSILTPFLSQFCYIMSIADLISCKEFGKWGGSSMCSRPNTLAPWLIARSTFRMRIQDVWVQQIKKTSWGWDVPSSAQLKLGARYQLAGAYNLSQLWLELEA